MGSPVTDFTSLLRDIEAKGKDVELKNDQNRQALLTSARALVSALESPAERIARISWHELQEDNGSPKSVGELAKGTNADPKLLERFLKHLAAANILKETDVDEYAPNATSTLLATPPAQGTILNIYDALAVSTPRIAEFLQKTNYQNPTDKDNSPWTFAQNSPQHYFQWLFSPGNERQIEAFHNCMKFKTLGKKWFEAVPIPDLFADFKRDDPDAVLMVDVGGNGGYDILDFHKAWPNQSGRLIVEDLPSLIQTIDTEGLRPIEAIGHDFFTPQPVKGAKAYYLKMVLHDWPDASCVEILSNLKSALEPGYSKILINEIVIPDRDAQWYSTSLDLLMMVVHAAAERREKHWRALIESAGLKVSKIWDCEGTAEKLIEVDLV